jgi:hypothetical protein
MITKIIYDEYACTDYYDEQIYKPRAKAVILAFILSFVYFYFVYQKIAKIFQGEEFHCPYPRILHVCSIILTQYQVSHAPGDEA